MLNRIPSPGSTKRIARIARIARIPSGRGGRGGFTLVELLVVIAIIGVIAAMLLPAIGIVRRRAYEMQVNVEISQIEKGLQNFENKYGSLPPDFSDVEAGLPFPRSVAYRFIRKTWPKITAQELTLIQYLATNPPPSGGTDPINFLDNDTCVWFWLSGLSDSSTNPFTGPGGPLSNNSLNNAMFQFVEERLRQARPVIPDTDPNNPTGRPLVIRHYVPQRIEKPYIYFDSRTYSRAVFDATVFGAGPDFARPYYLEPRADGWAEKADFQIVASGRDEFFSGPNLNNGSSPGPGWIFPLAYDKTGWDPDDATFVVPPAYFENHEDNFTNFGKVLGDFERE